ncbi:SRPBCC family protein [Rathayibacter sp. CAU 1779]
MSNELTVNAPDGLPFVDFTREFDAPVEAVFRAYKDPALYRQWNGPRGYEMDLQEYDFTTGGRYRYVHRDPEGNEFGFRGVFHKVRDNEFAVQTFEFDGVPDAVSIEFITFEALPDGRSRVSGHAVYPTLEGRDGIVAMGMEDGMRDGYDKLEEIASR